MVVVRGVGGSWIGVHAVMSGFFLECVKRQLKQHIMGGAGRARTDDDRIMSSGL